MGVGFESIIPYQDSNQNQCLSTREFYRACPSNLTASDAQFYRACPSNLTASDTQFTTYEQNRHLQTAISERIFTNWMDKISKLSQSVRQSPVQSMTSMGMTGNSTGQSKKIKIVSFIKVHVSQLPYSIWKTLSFEIMLLDPTLKNQHNWYCNTIFHC